jgi:hypothetical protein
LTVNAAGDVNVSDSNSAVTLNPSSGNNFSLSSGGSIATNGSTTASGTLTLATNYLSVGSSDTLSGSSVAVNGFSAQDLTVNNQGNLTATASGGTVALTSAAGTNLFVLGGGSLNAGGSVELTATESGSASNQVNFTGNQTFNGNTYWNATGGNQAVVIDNGSTVTVNGVLGLNTPLFMQNGTLNTNGAVIVSGESLTYANSDAVAGLLLPGNLIFSGSSLTLLSAGNIRSNGSLIDLSSSTGMVAA